MTILTVAAALGSGLIAGVFFAFSGFVMPALARLAPADGAAAMQSINRLALTAPLMLALFGTAAACLAAVIWGALDGEPLVAAAGAVYLIGTLGVTIVANVPRNEALERDAATWSSYLPEWTAWNHVRTLASLVAAGLFTLALT